MQQLNEIIILDIDSKFVRLITADVLPNGLFNVNNILIDSFDGIEEGRIINPDILFANIKKMIKIYESSGKRINKLFVAIPSELTFVLQGKYQYLFKKLTRITQEIKSDILTASTHIAGLPENVVSIDVHAIDFFVKNGYRVDECVDIETSDIEVNSMVTFTSLPFINALNSVLSSIGINRPQYISTTYAIANTIFDKVGLEKHEQLIEFAAYTTNIVIYKGNAIIKKITCPFGYMSITESISTAYGISLDVAEQIVDRLNLALEYDNFDTINFTHNGEAYSFYVDDIYKLFTENMDKYIIQLNSAIENSDMHIPSFFVTYMTGEGMKIKGIKEYFTHKLARYLEVKKPTLTKFNKVEHMRIVSLITYANKMVTNDSTGLLAKLKKIIKYK